jgi:hypothetical protein
MRPKNTVEKIAIAIAIIFAVVAINGAIVVISNL